MPLSKWIGLAVVGAAATVGSTQISGGPAHRPLTRELPPGRWAVSFDLQGGSVDVGLGSPGVRFVVRSGSHHVEIAGGRARTLVAIDGRSVVAPRAVGSRLSLTPHGAATVSALIVSSLSDRAALLLHRLAELHARLGRGQWVIGATGRDRLRLGFYWTNGFLAGAYWQAAALAPAGGLFERWALRETLRHLGYERTPTHDVGFMYGESSLAAWQALCPGQAVCARLKRSVVAASNELVALAATNRGAGTIPTDPSSHYGETIVDSMMNIGILPWATRFTGRPLYTRLAIHQADALARLLVRRNGSTAQAINYDRATGRVVSIATHQGLSAASTWSRGEGWALYGFAQLAAQLHIKRFLVVGERIARYVARHLPTGAIPRWDYDAPARAPRDVSAAAITAAGLLHLAIACDRFRGGCAGRQGWVALASRMLGAALAGASSTPPLGYLGGQITDERIRNCVCNGGELIYGLTYALEAARLAAAMPSG